AAGQVYHNGFVMDAQKEFAEAALLLAIVAGRELPTPASLDIEGAPYLNGLAEAAGELRRSVLDVLKHKDYLAAQERLEALDSIYHLLVTFDYPDAVAYGLKRRLDMVRGVLERTQSDVLITIREADLQTALERVEARLREQGPAGPIS
ncbi:MAG: haloacid dehalogenase, partial [Armatimonadetes bacterium]|nr:haloacid dehalogenase [Armatimonadota bacterium]